MLAILFIVGLVLLVYGADWLVDGASSIAKRLGIPPLVIGLTIVAFGTSAPEMAVSTRASLAGQADLALGNALGSNIFNILFILGVSAIITPLAVTRQIIRIEVPIVIAATVLLLLMGMDYELTRTEGWVLLGGILVYTLFQASKSFAGKGRDVADTEEKIKEMPIGRAVIMFVVGLVGLVIGASLLVDAAVGIARSLGVSELVIGLTIVAAGTSLPEVATSVMASIRGQRDIAVGNVLGSNVFNIFAVCGLAAVCSPEAIAVSQHMQWVDIPVALAAAIVCLPVFAAGAVISRTDGFLFLSCFIVYNLYIVLYASGSQWLNLYATFFGWAVIPVTMLVLFHSLRDSRTRAMEAIERLPWKQRRSLRSRLVCIQRRGLHLALALLLTPLLPLVLVDAPGRYVVPVMVLLVGLSWVLLQEQFRRVRRRAEQLARQTA
jgi:cation:H+ antiporter